MTVADLEPGSHDPGRRREGRGRCSSIDMLPEECDEDIAWANAQLAERKMPQTEILRAFNARLAEKGVAGVSKSAFSRHSVRLAIELRKLDASRKITELVMARLPRGERSDSMIAATELLKFRILELVTADEEPDLKQLGNAALSLQRLAATAARVDESQRREQRHQQDVEEREEERKNRQVMLEAEAAAETAARIAGEAGLTAERIAAIRRGVLGLAG